MQQENKIRYVLCGQEIPIKTISIHQRVRKASPIHKLIEVLKQSNFGTGQQLKVNYMFLDNTMLLTSSSKSS